MLWPVQGFPFYLRPNTILLYMYIHPLCLSIYLLQTLGLLLPLTIVSNAAVNIRVQIPTCARHITPLPMSAPYT